MGDEQILKARVYELEGQVEALHQSLVTLINLLGPDVRDEFANLTAQIPGRIALSNLQATNALDVELLRISEDCLEPLVGNDD